MKTYLDYAATTPVDKRVLDAMQPYFSEKFGNPSSIHLYGQQAESAMETAREAIAEVINADPGEIIFTSCGSESDNLALRGVAYAARRNRNARHILISPVEHHAVSHTATQLADIHGFEVELLPVDSYGRVNPTEVEARLRPDTALVSVILANNEIGTINPVREIADICRAQNIPFHTDAVQAGAHLKLDMKALGIDLLSIGAHKFYGPKGVGALYVRHGTPIVPILTGGGQENAMRAGTSNIAFIVGMAEALQLAQHNVQEHQVEILPLRDRIIGQVLEEIPDAALTGHPLERLPNHASFVFKNVDGNALLMLLDMNGFSVSSGSACKTGLPEPSDVLLALGLTREYALGSLRVTMGNDTTADEVEAFLQVLPVVVEKARNSGS